MPLGVALSGGGVTGILGGVCALHALDVHAPYPATATVSTVSGGTIGKGVHVNAGERLGYVAYDSGIEGGAAGSDEVADGRVWFGNIVNYLNWIPMITSTGISTGTTTGATTGTDYSSVQSGWWANAIDLAFWEGYGVHDYDITGGGADDATWFANFALIGMEVCPIERDGEGVMVDAEKSLVHAAMNMNTGAISSASDLELSLKHSSVLDVMAYSSSFWTASILEDKTQYFFLKGTIPTGDLGGSDVYLNDGGIVDTTGIVTLLQQQTDTIVSFYNNNDPLATLNSTFADLFGVDVATDTMNSLEGSVLGQVFDEELFPAVIANLTDGNVLRARLSNVKVRDNSFLNVKRYVVKELIIFSNEYSDEFVDSFQDASIKANLDKEWPNSFPVSMPVLDANMLCMFNDWKVQKYKEELEAVIVQ